MSEVTNELMYEVLKQIQARLGVIEDGQREIRSELKSMRIQLQAVQVDIANVYETTGTMDSGMSRIERRLDLSEVPVQ
jgi:chromosome segregation ATPase